MAKKPQTPSERLAILQAQLDERANAVMQAKIKTFKDAIEKAVTTLLGSSHQSCDQFGQYYKAADLQPYHNPEVMLAKVQVLQLAIRSFDADGKQLLWPHILWQQQSDAIRKDLFAKLDLFQQLATPEPRDASNDVPSDGPSLHKQRIEA